jgi:hypothetical protein
MDSCISVSLGQTNTKDPCIGVIFLVARAKPKHQCDLRVDKGHEWIHALVLVWGKLTQKIYA